MNKNSTDAFDYYKSVATSKTKNNGYDILTWPDMPWTFRENYDEDWAGPIGGFTTVLQFTPEWRRLIAIRQLEDRFTKIVSPKFTEELWNGSVSESIMRDVADCAFQGLELRSIQIAIGAINIYVRLSKSASAGSDARKAWAASQAQAILDQSRIVCPDDEQWLLAKANAASDPSKKREFLSQIIDPKLLRDATQQIAAVDRKTKNLEISQLRSLGGIQLFPYGELNQERMNARALFMSSKKSKDKNGMRQVADHLYRIGVIWHVAQEIYLQYNWAPKPYNENGDRDPSSELLQKKLMTKLGSMTKTVNTISYATHGRIIHVIHADDALSVRDYKWLEETFGPNDLGFRPFDAVAQLGKWPAHGDHLIS